MPPDLAPMLVMMTGILTAGGVILFRPLSKRLAELLHAMSEERLNPARGAETARLRETVTQLEQRIALLEERQNFTESLLERRVPSSRDAPAIGSGDSLRGLS